jgi:hypothetical protein
MGICMCRTLELPRRERGRFCGSAFSSWLDFDERLIV